MCKRVRSPVADVLRARVVHLHHHEHMLEVRADVLGAEGLGSGLLEHDGDDVVPDVPFPEQLQEMKHRREFRHARHLQHFLNTGVNDLPAACCWACKAAWWTRGTLSRSLYKWCIRSESRSSRLEDKTRYHF